MPRFEGTKEGEVIRTLRIEWHPGRKITGRFDVPAEPSGAAILLAHGAGAGQGHPFMSGLRSRLAAAGHPTLTFDYPYMEAGRKAPDRMPVLLACHRAVMLRLRRYGWPIVLAGKSMGGRVASHLAVEEAALGIVFYGYPLISPSSGVLRPTDHLRDAGLPMLFLAGSRDRLAPLGELDPLVESLPRSTLEVVQGGDHSFKVPKRLGLPEGEILDRLAAVTVATVRNW